jgi:chemotaxis protein MotB
MRKKSEDEVKKMPSWMATFLDSMMLLLTFFVLLMSMVTFEKIKLEQAAGSLRESFGVLKKGAKTEIEKESIFKETQIVEEIQSTRKLMSGLVNYIESVNLDNFISVIETDSGVSIRIMDSVLYGLGDATLRESAYAILDKISAIVKNAPYNIIVEGHTDDLPMRPNARFQSNWELSTARAVSVVRYFIEKGVNPKKLAAAGFAEFHPLVPNINEENRAKNRRVEINFISPEFMRKNMKEF